MTFVILVSEVSPCKSDHYNGNLIQVLRNEHSPPEEECVSTRATMESAELTVDGSLNKSDSLTIEQAVNGQEGRKTAFESSADGVDEAGEVK